MWGRGEVGGTQRPSPVGMVRRSAVCHLIISESVLILSGLNGVLLVLVSHCVPSRLASVKLRIRTSLLGTSLVVPDPDIGQSASSLADRPNGQSNFLRVLRQYFSTFSHAARLPLKASSSTNLVISLLLYRGTISISPIWRRQQSEVIELDAAKSHWLANLAVSANRAVTAANPSVALVNAGISP